MNAHVTDRLSAYLDGALPARELESVRAHLAACGTCLRAYEELGALKALLGGLPDPVPPPGLAERIRWRLLRQAARPQAGAWTGSVPRGLRLVVACAAGVLVLLLPLGWIGGQRSPREAPLDTDAYFRDYLVLAADHPLADEVTPALLTGEGVVQDPALR